MTRHMMLLIVENEAGGFNSLSTACRKHVKRFGFQCSKVLELEGWAIHRLGRHIQNIRCRALI